MTEDLKDIVIKNIAQCLQVTNIKEIDMHDNLNDLGVCSIKMIRLIVILEEHFDIIFNDEELLFENFNTLSNILNIIQLKLK
ncbi:MULTISPECIES: acyl carrier protein [Paenibacillus]|uniref:acyl carrier protein n=1 Tax=Paenibacillus TaxID=44249 RepID=UPI0009A5A94A|nr:MULTISPECIES: acyl carrier protein [Paenibacillus]WDQ32379.1 acyl carrier protein [Paenibacillus marchantiae]SLK20135.1 Acyl carrier protein [Paenibacillus sp. RU5A]SOC76078.1 Acyl carrier protein [Paenibacillus sp. RU26A]SOC77787.1 Acyl carrier protein [Paenibacillus sp. RU5M]